jgi:hypothetical protein
MPIQDNDPKTRIRENPKPIDAAADQRLNRIAEEAAEKGSETEQSYDENHDIFTK